jgi:hypothetical protein
MKETSIERVSNNGILATTGINDLNFVGAMILLNHAVKKATIPPINAEWNN